MSESILNVDGPARAEARAPLSWLTWEMALYGAVWLLGMGLRLAAMGRWPLMEMGTGTALAAWRTVAGDPWRPTHYVPLLYDAHLITFYLMRATDGAARLLPLLASGWLMLLPSMAKDVLGRWGALLATLLLAIAPSWAFYSVVADGPILTATAIATLLLLGHRYASTREPRYALWASGVLALGLTAGPSIYTPLFALMAGGVVHALAMRDRAWVGEAKRELTELPWSQMALVFLGTFCLAATAFLANPGGIGASVEQLGVWWRHLAPGTSGLRWHAYPAALATYESLTLVLAIVGAVYGLIGKKRRDMVLVGWVAIALLLGTLFGHRRPMWLLDVALPLVILAACGFDHLVEHLAPDASLPDLAVMAAGLVLVAFGFLQLATYMHTADENLLTYAAIVYGLLIVALVGYGLLGYGGSALRVGTVLALFIAGVIMVRATAALLFQTGRDARERMLYRPASIELSEVRALLLELSSKRAGDPHLLDIAYDRTLDPWVGWATRDMVAAEAVDGIGASPESTVLLTPAREADDWPVGYIGQRYAVTGTFSRQGLSTRERLKWFFYRNPVGADQPTDLHVWVRLPDQNDTRER